MARERKVHRPSGRKRVSFENTLSPIMLCGAGWGEPLLTTTNNDEVTCGRCLVIIRARRIPSD